VSQPSVFFHILAHTFAGDVDLVKYYIGGIGHKVLVLRAVSQIEIGDC
jgi:hypothetical protein